MSAQHACLLCRLPSLAAAVVALCMTAVGCANGKLDGDGPDDGSDGTTGDLTRGAGSSDSDAPVLLEATVRVEGEHCFLDPGTGTNDGGGSPGNSAGDRVAFGRLTLMHLSAKR